MKISEKLKELRNQNNITQTELAKNIKVALSIIGDIETDRRTPSKTTALKLANYFQTTVEFWLDGKDAKTYVEKREDFSTFFKAFNILKDKKHLKDGNVTDEDWEYLKRAITLDIKFMDLKDETKDKE